MSSNPPKDDKTSFHALGFCAKCVMGICLTVFLSGCFSSYVVSVSPKVRDSDIDKSKICPATVEFEGLYYAEGISAAYYHKSLYVVSEGDRPGTAALFLRGNVEHSESDWITLYHIFTLGILPIPNDNDTCSYELNRSRWWFFGREDFDMNLPEIVMNIECRVFRCESLFPTAYIPALIGFVKGDDVYMRFLGFGNDDGEFADSVLTEYFKKQAAAYLTKYGDKIPVREETDQERADRIRNMKRGGPFRFRHSIGVNAMVRTM